MNDKEKTLFKSLCNFKAKEIDQSLLAYATPAVLGHLFFNRMQAVAYGTLKEHDLLGKVNREFRNSLRDAYMQNKEKNKSYFACIRYVNTILRECTCRYAMLKGAVLCGYYPEGYRTSNDIDLLVMPEDVTQIGAVLLKAGFRQGNIRNGEFVPATRKEIIESKILRGETVPYIKEVSLPCMRFLEIDINFSLDFKSGETEALRKMLDRVKIYSVLDFKVPALEESDFMIHLCAHLYKEATTLPWVQMKRDMTLYKFCDIYMLLSHMDDEKTAAFFDRAKELGLEKICSFAVLYAAELFDVDNSAAVSIARNVLAIDPDFLHTVASPKDKTFLRYEEENIFRRFFFENRSVLLQEVKNDATT